MIELPTCPGREAAPAAYGCRFEWEHLVARWCGVPMREVGGFPYTYYLIMRRDAFVGSLMESERGRAYLDDARRLAQTGFDAASMRETFGAAPKT